MTTLEQFAAALSTVHDTNNQFYLLGWVHGRCAREASENENHKFNAEQATVPLPNEQKTADAT